MAVTISPHFYLTNDFLYANMKLAASCTTSRHVRLFSDIPGFCLLIAAVTIVMVAEGLFR